MKIKELSLIENISEEIHFNNNYHYLFLEKDENGREIKIYHLKDVIFTGYSFIYPNVLLYSNQDKNLYIPIKEKTMSLQYGTIYEKMNMEFNPEVTFIKHEDTPVFFFVYNTDNYFHFLYDSLPNLISYFHLKKKIPNIKLLISYPNEQKDNLYKFVEEFYELLGIKDDLIFIEKNTNYNNVYITTSYTHDFDSNLPPRKEIYDFFKSIVEKVPKNQNTPKKIYISRRTWIHNQLDNIGTNYTSRRKCINENELVDYLIKDGFTEVFTENLTTIEKIQYFMNAEVVIGAIGGGISNVLFSNPDTKLIALISPGFLEINKRFSFCFSNLRCVKFFKNSNHYTQDEFKLYMRIKEKDTNLIGEIEDIKDNKVLISFTDGSNTGWNSEIKYSRKWIDKNKIIKLDNGLNSPWIIELQKLEL